MIGLGTIASAVVATLFGAFVFVVAALTVIVVPTLLKERLTPPVSEWFERHPKINRVKEAVLDAGAIFLLAVFVAALVLVAFSIGMTLLTALF